jgi:hypothetical protein
VQDKKIAYNIEPCEALNSSRQIVVYFFSSEAVYSKSNEKKFIIENALLRKNTLYSIICVHFRYWTPYFLQQLFTTIKSSRDYRFQSWYM